MPSSMRDTTTVSGVVVMHGRKASVASAEAEADRHAKQHAGASSPRRRQHEVPVADRLQQRRPPSTQRRRRARPAPPRRRPGRPARCRTSCSAHDASMSANPTGIAAGAHHVRPAERRRLDIPLVLRVLRGMRQHQRQEQPRQPPTASACARPCQAGRSAPTTAVSRMCCPLQRDRRCPAWPATGTGC